MLKKLWTNGFWLMWCIAFLSAVGAIICPPLAGVQGVEPQGLALDPDRGAESLSVPTADQGGVDSYTKLMLHADGSDQGTSFTDSETTPKTVTNTETYDSYTKLMLHMEGSGNNFVDSAAFKAVTANGDVTQTTAQFKLGSTSAVFDGTGSVDGRGDYLSLANSNDWSFGSGDFTIDTWIRFNSISSSDIQIIASNWDTTGNNRSWMLFYYYGGNGLYFNYSTEGSSQSSNSGGVAWYPVANTWYHITVVRSGSNKIF